MVDFFDYLYWCIPRKKGLLNNLKLYSLLRFLIRISANMFIPIYFRFTQFNNKYKIQECAKSVDRIIVSLTSFPARIDRLWLVIETLLRQTKKPDMIILWLSKKQFASIDVLPKRLLDQQRRGLKIVLKEEDFRSHKKYYYTLNEYPRDILITVDDDIFYRTDMISVLLSYHYRYPGYVIANFAFKMKYFNRELLPYNCWVNNNDIYNEIRGYDVFFGSGGGTLFPRNSLNEMAYSSDDFMQLCPFADDVWLNAMCRINNYPVLKTEYNSLCLPILNKNDVRLTTQNVINNKNDIQIKSIREYCLKKIAIDPFFCSL